MVKLISNQHMGSVVRLKCMNFCQFESQGLVELHEKVRVYVRTYEVGMRAVRCNHEVAHLCFNARDIARFVQKRTY